MSTLFFIGTSGSEYDIQDPPSSLKLIFVTCVLLLVMYTCQQMCRKIHHEQRHFNKTNDSRTREGNVPEKSLHTAEEEAIKKRRVRKKKPRKQNHENGEVLKDTSKERERTPENCVDDEAPFVKRQNKTPRRDKEDLEGRPSGRDHGCEIPDSSTPVEQAKCGRRRKKTPKRGGPELESACKRGANDSEIPQASRPAERDKKYVERRNKFVVSDGADQDGGVVKHTEKKKEDTASKKAVEQDKDVKRRNKHFNSKHVDESRKDSEKSGVVDGVRDIDNPSDKIVSKDKRERGVNGDTTQVEEEKYVKKHNGVVTPRRASDNLENVDAVKEIREVKSSVKLFSSKLFENAIRSVCIVHDKTTRRRKKLPGNTHGLLQAHDREDFVEKVLIKHAAKETEHLDEVQKQTLLDSEANRVWTGNVCRGENSEDFEKRSRDDGRLGSGGSSIGARRWRSDRHRTTNGKENNGPYNGGRRGTGNTLKDDPERNLDVYPARRHSGHVFGRKEERYSEDHGLQAMDPSGDNREFEQGAVFGDKSDTQPETQIKIFSQTEKEVESPKRRVQFGSSSSRQDLQITSERHFVIDPEVRGRIAHPKYPVRVPDRPLDNLDLNDPSRRDYLNYTPGRNVSRVNGLFGRKWEEMMDRRQEKEFAEEDRKFENESVVFIRDCPTFMIWGACHRGERCELRHPSYRYLERAAPSPAAKPEPVQKEPKPQNSRSYAAILEKTKSPANADFVNIALSKEGSSEGNFEDEWPALGSPGNGEASKSRKFKSAVQNELKVQELKNVCHTEPAVKGSMSGQAQIASDQLIAETLQVDEYAEFNDFNDDDYLYPANQDQELNEEDYYNEQVEGTLEDDENSFDTSEVGGKAVHVERFNSFNFSPFIKESTLDRGEEPEKVEVSTTCDICMDRPKDAALICGHRFCYQCALQMRADERVCAICRRCIVSVIKTFN